MRIECDNLWLCVDCTQAACNGLDVIGDSERVPAIKNGLAKLGAHLVPDFDSESGDGLREFSNLVLDKMSARHVR